MSGVLRMTKSEVTFESNLTEAKSKMGNAQRAGVIASLETLERHVKYYSRAKSGGTRDSYTHELQGDEGGELIGAVGSDMMNAIYEEYGTGEFAENGDGRKGGWVYYDEKEDEFYFTYGKAPNKPLRRAAQVSMEEIKNILGNHYSVEF